MKIKRFYQIIFYMTICVILTPVVNSDFNYDDYLDQEQIYCSNGFWAVETPCIISQSFKPTLNVLTRVSLYGWRNEITPNSFRLEQNYPNPFNPTTTIKYQLGNDGFVNLKVFNSLGEEIAELVNEFRKGGSYQVTFDAAELPSGIYVYQISSGNYIETKKMLFIK